MKKAKLPKTVLIAGIDFTVQFFDSDGCWDDGQWGWTDIDKRAIWIYPYQVSQQREALETLFHEMHHASLQIGGLAETLKGEREEAVVRNFDGIFLPAITKVMSETGYLEMK